MQLTSDAIESLFSIVGPTDGAAAQVQREKERKKEIFLEKGMLEKKNAAAEDK